MISNKCSKKDLGKGVCNTSNNSGINVLQQGCAQGHKTSQMLGVQVLPRKLGYGPSPSGIQRHKSYNGELCGRGGGAQGLTELRGTNPLRTIQWGGWGTRPTYIQGYKTSNTSSYWDDQQGQKAQCLLRFMNKSLQIGLQWSRGHQATHHLGAHVLQW